jgi:hypothetical protein
VKIKLTIEDKQEALENALTALDDATDALKDMPECEAVRDVIFEMISNLQEQLDEVNADAERAYADMIRDMTRDYWRAVL